MAYKKDQSLADYIQYCKGMDVQLIVIVGEAQKERGGVKLYNLVTNKEVWKKIIFKVTEYFFQNPKFVPLNDLVQEVKAQLHIT